jgi:glycosyltransferase involved in cell wall biosynthesis
MGVMNKRALIFIPTYFPIVGGAEVALREITDRLPDWQFDLICARVRRDFVKTERIGNVNVHRVGFGMPIDKILLPFLGPLRALRIKGSKDAVDWAYMASYGGFAALMYTKLRPKTKMLLTLQEGDPLEHYAKRVGRLAFLHKEIFQRANTVQAISRFLGEWSTKMGFQGTPHIIPNGVDLERFSVRISPERRAEIRRSFGCTDQEFVMVTASRLVLKNGVDDLARSLGYLDAKYKLVIAGEGEDKEKITSLVMQKGLTDRVVFLGTKTHQELTEILQASDVFVRPSRSEGLGNSFLEAMAAGVPIVGTPVGGIPDFLTDGETGMLCQPNDPESIAKAVRKIADDPILRAKIIRQGEALVHERYGWGKIAERMEKLLSSLLT